MSLKKKNKNKKNITFKESLLIPFSYYEENKATTPLTSDPAASILLQKELPADIKLKQFDSFLRRNKKDKRSSRLSKQEVELPPPLALENISDANKPIALSILSFIRESNEVSWDWKYQIIVDNKVFTGSDLRKIIQYFVGELVITDSRIDIPHGAEELKNKLKLLEIPSAWLKLIPRRSARTKNVKRKVKRIESDDEEEEKGKRRKVEEKLIKQSRVKKSESEEEEEAEEEEEEKSQFLKEKEKFKAQHAQRQSARLKKKQQRKSWIVYD